MHRKFLKKLKLSDIEMHTTGLSVAPHKPHKFQVGSRDKTYLRLVIIYKFIYLFIYALAIIYLFI